MGVNGVAHPARPLVALRVSRTVPLYRPIELDIRAPHIVELSREKSALAVVGVDRGGLGRCDSGGTEQQGSPVVRRRTERTTNPAIRRRRSPGTVARRATGLLRDRRGS